MTELSKSPIRLALIGNSIQSSLSPQVYEALSQLTEQPHTFQLIECSEGQFDERFQTASRSFDAVAITSPFKARAFTYAKSFDIPALRCKSGNCFVTDSLKLLNTDVFGLINGFPWTTFQPDRILILGNGASARTAIYAAQLMYETKPIVLFGRDREKTSSIIHLMETVSQSPIVAWDERHIEAPGSWLVIHAASIPFEINRWPNLRQLQTLATFDLNYPRSSGAERPDLYFDGTGMLIQQAAKNWETWTHTPILASDLNHVLEKFVCKFTWQANPTALES